MKDGARAVIALPYKVLNAGAETLMSAFYRSFLTDTWDLALSLAQARNAMMMMQVREARYGIMVPVDDWIVPTLWHNGATEVSVVGTDEDYFSSLSPAAARSPVGAKLFSRFGDFLQVTSPGRGRPQSSDGERGPNNISEAFLTRGEMVGRDGDIFDMETRFLMESNILQLLGAPGIGMLQRPEDEEVRTDAKHRKIDIDRSPMLVVESHLADPRLFLLLLLPKAALNSRDDLSADLSHLISTHRRKEMESQPE